MRRRDPEGREVPGFVLNEDRYRHAQILVAGDNFGCGSSSESSVWVPVAFGIRCIVARSFADIYRENCLKNGVLPVVLGPDAAQSFKTAVLSVDGSAPFTVDLVEQQISGAGGEWAFEVSPGERQALLEGLDPIGLSLRHKDAIAAFEKKTADAWPWLASIERSA